MPFPAHSAVLMSFFVTTAAAQDLNSPEKWEKSIQTFEQKIASGESRPGSVLFIGSSSIRLWDLPKWFPRFRTVNHGFGGSETSDSLHFFDRIVKPLKPSFVVLYAGDNDIAKQKTAEIVHRDFTAFATRVKADLPPETKLAYIAIKPSLKRWNLSPEMTKANDLIARDCQADDRLEYVDIWTPMLGNDGKPRPELFAKDGLHLNENGYQLWTSIVIKVLPDRTSSE